MSDPPSAQPDPNSFRILVAEDDQNLRDVLQEVLSDQGWRVVATSCGEEALGWAARERFDLILADIDLKGSSGLDIIERARRLQPGIGSIVASGDASQEDLRRVARLGVAAYLKKPFRLTEMMDIIGTFLTERAQPQPQLEPQPQPQPVRQLRNMGQEHCQPVVSVFSSSGQPPGSPGAPRTAGASSRNLTLASAKTPGAIRENRGGLAKILRRVP